VSALAGEVNGYPNIAALAARQPARRWPEEPALIVPWRLRLNGAELSLFTTLTTFGTPRDITLAELAVELFYPADERTAAALRAWTGEAGELARPPRAGSRGAAGREVL
jgi:hypothetical protein